MNRRQKKKQFKKRFGINPPRGISIKTATCTMQHREKVIAAFERIKKAILDLWEMIKQPALELATALKEAMTALISDKEKRRRQYAALQVFQTKVITQQRQQESEVMQIESNINISNHDRRKSKRNNKAFQYIYSNEDMRCSKRVQIQGTGNLHNEKRRCIFSQYK